MGVEVVNLDAVEATPHAALFENEPKTIRLSLAAGEEIAPHQHPDRKIVFHLLEGEVVVTIGGTEHALAPGEVARFDGDQDVSPRALEDSTALLVLAQRTDE